MARIDNNDIVELSVLLGNLPYDFSIEKYSGPEGGVSVTLHHPYNAIFSEAASGDGKTFAIAYTRAEQKLTRLLQEFRVAENTDYAATIASVVQGRL